MLRFRPHYAWAVLAAATLLIFCQGLVTNGFAVYLPFLRDSYAITNTQASMLSTVRCVTALASLLVVRAYYRHLSLRAGGALALGVLAAGFAACWLWPTYLGACVGSALMGVTCGLGSMVPAAMLVHRWFEDERALALGICTAGSGLSSVVAAPLVTAGVSTVGLGATFALEGIAVLVLAALVFAIVRDNPSACGSYRIDGASSASPQRTKVPGASRRLSGAGVAAMFVAVLLLGSVASPGPAHYGLLFGDAGIGSAVIAATIGASGAAIVVGKLVYGVLTERWGAYRTNAIFLCLLASGMACSLMLDLFGAGAAFALVILCGLGFPPATAGTAVWASDLNDAAYDRTVQLFQVAYVLGNLVGMPIPGIVADATGSYVPVFASYVLVVAATLAIVQLRYRASGLAASMPGTPRPRLRRRALRSVPGMGAGR